MTRVWTTFNFRVVRSRRRTVIRCTTTDLARVWEPGHAQVEIICEQLRLASRACFAKHELTFSSVERVEEGLDRLKFIGCELEVSTGVFGPTRAAERIDEFVAMLRAEYMRVSRHECACSDLSYRLSAMLEVK